MVWSPSSLTIEEVAALFHFDYLNSQQIEGVAERWLGEGHDHPAILELAFPDDLNLTERKALMSDALSSLGVNPNPDARTCLWLLNRYLIARLASRDDDYLLILLKMVKLELHKGEIDLGFRSEWRDYVMECGWTHRPSERWVGDSSAINELYALYYSHDDVRSGWTAAHEAERREDVTKTAKRLLERFYCPSRLASFPNIKIEATSQSPLP